jgi:hypothetical protein
MDMTSPRNRCRAPDERVAARRALIMDGLSADEAAYWCATWEAEAARQNLRPGSQYFWDAGLGWIDAQRSYRRRSLAAAGGANPRPAP